MPCALLMNAADHTCLESYKTWTHSEVRNSIISSCQRRPVQIVSFELAGPSRKSGWGNAVHMFLGSVSYIVYATSVFYVWVCFGFVVQLEEREHGELNAISVRKSRILASSGTILAAVVQQIIFCVQRNALNPNYLHECGIHCHPNLQKCNTFFCSHLAKRKNIATATLTSPSYCTMSGN